MSNIIDSIRLSGTTYQIQGEITVDAALDSGSTNPVQNQALYNELRLNVTEQTETLLQWEQSDGGESTNYPSGCTKITVEVDENEMTSGAYTLYNDNHDCFGAFVIESNGGVITVSTIDCESEPTTSITYSISDNVVTIEYPTITNVTIIGTAYDNYWAIKAISGTSTVTPLIDQVSANTTALGAVESRIAEDEEVTAAGLNALNDKITPTVELTQAQYDALTTKDPNTYYIITDAQAGDLTNYYTKTETNTLLGGKADTATTYTKTEVDTALNGKQPTLISGTNIKTINNESILGSGNIEIQGGSGGKAVSGGTNISITTGETADTINCTLPFSYEGDNLKTTVSGNSFVNYFHYGQIFGVNNTLQGRNSDISNTESGSTIIGNGNQILRNTNSIVIGSSNSLGNIFGINNQNYVFGYSNTLNPAGTNDNIINNNFVIGNNNVINKKNNNFIFGYGIKPSNDDEFALGKYNNSVSATTTFGDSGNTLFSVGNGTSNSARHNAFEIRQNGDIYLSLNGQDVKLQDQLGGSSITVDTSLDSGSTNPVENKAIYNKIDEVEQVTAAGLNALNDKFDGLKLVKLTQAEYNALATKDSSTLYIIVN